MHPSTLTSKRMPESTNVVVYSRDRAQVESGRDFLPKRLSPSAVLGEDETCDILLRHALVLRDIEYKRRLKHA